MDHPPTGSVTPLSAPPSDALWELSHENQESEAWAYTDDNGWRFLSPEHSDAAGTGTHWTAVLFDKEANVVDEAETDFAALLEQLPPLVWPWAIKAIRLAIDDFQDLAEESDTEGGADASDEMRQLADELQAQLDKAYQQHGAPRLDAPEPRAEHRKAVPSMEEHQLGLLRSEAGIDAASPEDAEALLSLAAIGMTNSLWRNSPLEAAHGEYHTPHHTDAAMMRNNIATTLAVRRHLSINDLDAAAIIVELTDPDRTLPGGVTTRTLLGGKWDDYVAHVRGEAESLEQVVREFGERTILMSYATHGAVACGSWFGTPWWPDVVDVFIEMLIDPDSAAWRFDERDEPEPESVRDRDALRNALLSNPGNISLDAVHWCLDHGLGFRPTTEGHRRYLTRRNATAA